MLKMPKTVRLRGVERAVVEKDVEGAYRDAIRRARPAAVITSPHRTDGYAKWGTVRLLLEAKYDLDLKARAPACNTLGQCILYLKRFEASGEPLPNVILVGDKNECFVLSTAAVKGFLDLPIDWSVAPSTGNPALTRALVDGMNILPYVYDVNDRFHFEKVVAQIETLAAGERSSVKATTSNLGALYLYWEEHVFKVSSLTPTEKVDVFLLCLFKPKDVYLHPKRKGVLVVPGYDGVVVNPDQYKSFFSHFEQGYKPSEVRTFYATKDRLIEDDARRRQGAFFTPDIWVSLAHDSLDHVLGPRWRQECIVWDPACYDAQTRVMTDSGWAFFRDLKGDERIYSLNPDTLHGEYVPFTDYVAKPFTGDLDHYTGQRLDLAVTPDHQMAVFPRRRNDRKDRHVYMEKSLSLRSRLERGNKLAFPSAAPLVIGTPTSLSDDELRFLGFWLGDGYLFHDKHRAPNAVGFGLKKTRKRKYLADLCLRLKLPLTEYPEDGGGKAGFRIRSPFWVRKLAPLKGVFNKRVPEDCREIPANQARYLLEGLWESDGSGHYFYSANRSLAEDVQRLCIHAGQNTHLRCRERICTPPGAPRALESVCWEISSASGGRGPRKTCAKSNTSSLAYDGMVYCVTLARNHIMLVERNGHTVFCGNCGTANLTRDYQFSDLIISTAEAPDVQVIRDQKYNPGAQVFQFDFLNPAAQSTFFDEGATNEVPHAVHEHLKAAAKAGKRLVFLMNPPYAEHSIQSSQSRAGIAKTRVNGVMLRAKLGLASRQLYAQFMYQCHRLAEQYGFRQHTVALFSKPTFMSSGSYRAFRDWWVEDYACKDAWMFQASHFADVSGAWGISFTVWDRVKVVHWGPAPAGIPCTLKDVRDFRVASIGRKALYNSDDREASKWVREPIKGLKGVDAPQMTSGLRCVPDRGKKVLRGSLFSFNCHANVVQQSGTVTCLLPASSAMNAGVSVTPANWRRAIALYAARKLVAGNWINDKDEYLVPTTSPAYVSWVDDAHVYVILHNSNNCTAMRNVPYKDGPPGAKTWTIHNHFFPIAHADALASLDDPETGDIYNDCQANPSKDVWGNDVVSTPDPYMASILPGLNLSFEATEVLALWKTLWLNSLTTREDYAAAHPDLHLEVWDAGTYQLKHLWRTEYKDQWEELQAAFKDLAAKLKPGVYNHGFLLK